MCPHGDGLSLTRPIPALLPVLFLRRYLYGLFCLTLPTDECPASSNSYPSAQYEDDTHPPLHPISIDLCCPLGSAVRDHESRSCKCARLFSPDNRQFLCKYPRHRMGFRQSSFPRFVRFVETDPSDSVGFSSPTIFGSLNTVPLQFDCFIECVKNFIVVELWALACLVPFDYYVAETHTLPA